MLSKPISVVDLFCGAGGLTHGFALEGLPVLAGYDSDPNCRYAYESNNPTARFVCKAVEEVTAQELRAWYPPDGVSVLAGCAPCQPFSIYSQGRLDRHERWRLVSCFAELICSVRPTIVTMENVPALVRFKKRGVFGEFLHRLENAGYHIWFDPRVYCPDYGVPQQRTRLVMLGSLLGDIGPLARSQVPSAECTVRLAIGDLEPLEAGQASGTDRLHKASRLSPLNLQRIRASKPGGTWMDWDESLKAACHVKRSGGTYRSVYGRMRWDEPSPTITTQCYGFGNGRFGHPEQDRALSLREAALLQTFPRSYEFVPQDEPVRFKRVGALIGNAVPVLLARAIARTILRHVLTVTES